MLGVKRLKDMKKMSFSANVNSSIQSPTVMTANNQRSSGGTPSTPSRQTNGISSDRRPNVPIRQTKSTLERCNSLENNSIPSAVVQVNVRK